MKEYKPWHVEVAGEAASLFPDEETLVAYRGKSLDLTKKLGTLMVFHFWEQPDFDYLHSSFANHNVATFGELELATWVSGVALGRDRQRILSLANRTNGSFEDKFGWRPLTVIKYCPNETEQELFIKAENDTVDSEWEGWGED